MYKSYNQLGVQPEKNRDQFSVLEIKTQEDKQKLLSQNQIVVIDVYADWCGPCRQIAPEYSILAKTFNKPGLCALVKENLELRLTEGIQGVPSFFFFFQGKKVDEVVGGDLDSVRSKLEKLLGNVPEQRGVYSNMNQGYPQTPQYNRNSIRSHGSVHNGHRMPDNSDSQYY